MKIGNILRYILQDRTKAIYIAAILIKWELKISSQGWKLTLSLPDTRICVNFSTVYNDTLVAKGLNLQCYSNPASKIEGLHTNLTFPTEPNFFCYLSCESFENDFSYIQGIAIKQFRDQLIQLIQV